MACVLFVATLAVACALGALLWLLLPFPIAVVAGFIGGLVIGHVNNKVSERIDNKECV